MEKPAEQPVKKPDVRNIIVFGSSGSGKSSIVNLLAGTPLAETSGGAKGCTFQSEAYPVAIKGLVFTLYDTTGLDEGSAGTVTATEALLQLYELIMKLEGGLCLLIFTLRAGRLSETCGANWQLFDNIVCHNKVPICIAVTGLENEEDMGAWGRSDENRKTLEAYGMTPFCDIVGTTAILGKLKHGHYQFQEEYDESKVRLQETIVEHYLRTSWNPEPTKWYKEVVERTVHEKCLGANTVTDEALVVPGDALEELFSIRGYPDKVLQELAEAFKVSVGGNKKFQKVLDWIDSFFSKRERSKAATKV